MQFSIELQQIAPQSVAFASTVVQGQQWGPAYGPLLARVLAHIERSGGRVTAPPFARFAVFDDHVDLDAGIPVENVPAGDGIRLGQLSGGEAAVGRHVGPPSELGPAHEAVRAWLHERGIKPSEFWEVYYTDPKVEPDERRWQTDVVYLVATE